MCIKHTLATRSASICVFLSASFRKTISRDNLLVRSISTVVLCSTSIPLLYASAKQDVKVHRSKVVLLHLDASLSTVPLQKQYSLLAPPWSSCQLCCACRGHKTTDHNIHRAFARPYRNIHDMVRTLLLLAMVCRRPCHRQEVPIQDSSTLDCYGTLDRPIWRQHGSKQPTANSCR